MTDTYTAPRFTVGEHTSGITYRELLNVLTIARVLKIDTMKEGIRATITTGGPERYYIDAPHDSAHAEALRTAHRRYRNAQNAKHGPTITR